MVQTSSRRAGDQFVRGVMFAVALIAVAGGSYGVIAQHAFAAGIVVVIGLFALWLWYVMRPRQASARARRLGRLRALLTIAVTAAIVAGVVVLLGFPADGSPGTAQVTGVLIAAVAALALLVTRVLAGHHLKRLAAADAAALPAVTPQEEAAARYVQQEEDWRREQAQREFSDLQRQWQSGAAPRSPGLAAAADGTVVLRPQRIRGRNWLRGSVGVLPVILVLLLRLISFGLVGALVTAACVAVVLAAAVLSYEIRRRRGAARLTAADLVVPAWYGRPRSVPRSLVQRVVLVQAELGSTQSRVVPLLLMLGGDGRCLLRLSGGGIAEADLKGFAAALQVPVDVPARPLGPEDLRRDYPGSLSWGYEHQVLISLLVSAAIVAIVVAVVLALARTG